MIKFKQSRYNADKFILILSINEQTKPSKTHLIFALTCTFLPIVCVGVVRRAGRSIGGNSDQREDLPPVRRSARACRQVGAVGAILTNGKICGGRGGLQACVRCVGVAWRGVISMLISCNTLCYLPEEVATIRLNSSLIRGVKMLLRRNVG